jgi:small subunit ribosomal protein S35
MATIARRLVLSARRCPTPTAPRYTPLSAIPWQRRISTTVPRRNEYPKDERPARDEEPVESLKGVELDEETLDESDDQSVRQFIASLSKVRMEAMIDEMNAIPEDVNEDNDNLDEDSPYKNEMELSGEEEDVMTTLAPEPRIDKDFWDSGEDEHLGDEDYFGDDISALGHGELEQHRELREYARLAVWELPLLSSKYWISSTRMITTNNP